MAQDEQLAFIGLGNIGSGMAKNLAEKGSLTQPLILYNRTLSTADSLAQSLGPSLAIVSPSIADAVSRSTIIFLCLSNDSAVTSTLTTALDALASSNTKSTDPSKKPPEKKLFVDCSTVSPSTTTALATQCASASHSFLAMPVFGPPSAAQAGTLLCVPAGPPDLVARILPYTTSVLGRGYIDYSSRPPSDASLLKIVGNSLVLNMIEALSEAHTLAETTGLGSGALHSFVEQMFPGAYVAYSERMRSGEYWKREKPLFGVDLALKDAGHVLGLARESGAAMKGVEVVEGHLEELKREKGEKGDLPGVYGAVRKESGLPFEN